MIPKRSIEEKGELFKMNDSVKFSYMGTAKVTAHRGAGNLLGEIASRYGSRAFVIVSRSVSEYPCFQEAFGSVKERLSACLYPYSAGEPSPKGVKQATAAAVFWILARRFLRLFPMAEVLWIIWRAWARVQD